MKRLNDKNTRRKYWRRVPDATACSRIIAEGFYAIPINGNDRTGGYYNGGWEYKIMPLNSNLSQKGNDRQYEAKWKSDFNKRVYVGTEVTGDGVEDGEEHSGRVVNFSLNSKDSNVVKYVWIIDDETRDVIALVSSSVRVKKNDYDYYAMQTRYSVSNRERVSLDDIYSRRGRVCESVDIFSDDDSDEHVNEQKRSEDFPYREYVESIWSKVMQNCSEIMTRLDYVFYTDVCDENQRCLLMNEFDENYYRSAFGFDSNKTKTADYSKSMKEFLAVFFQLRKEGSRSITVKRRFRDSDSFDLNEDVKIYSYKDIYLLYAAAKIIYNKRRNTDDFILYRNTTNDYLAYGRNDNGPTNKEYHIVVLSKLISLYLLSLSYTYMNVRSDCLDEVLDEPGFELRSPVMHMWQRGIEYTTVETPRPIFLDKYN